MSLLILLHLVPGSEWVEPYFWCCSRTFWPGRTVSSSECIKLNFRVFSEWITNDMCYNFCCYPGICQDGSKKSTKIPSQGTVSWVIYEQGTSSIHVTSIIGTPTSLWTFTAVSLDQWQILIWWSGTWCLPIVLLLDLTSRSGFTTVIDIISINKEYVALGEAVVEGSKKCWLEREGGIQVATTAPTKDWTYPTQDIWGREHGGWLRKYLWLDT